MHHVRKSTHSGKVCWGFPAATTPLYCTVLQGVQYLSNFIRAPHSHRERRPEECFSFTAPHCTSLLSCAHCSLRPLLPHWHIEKRKSACCHHQRWVVHCTTLCFPFLTCCSSAIARLLRPHRRSLARLSVMGCFSRFRGLANAAILSEAVIP